VVHLTSARIGVVPKGMVIEHVWATRADSPGHVGGARGRDAINSFLPYMQEVSRVDLDPSCAPWWVCLDWRHPPGTPPYQNWSIMVQAHIIKPGAYLGKDLVVTYTVGKSTYVQTIPAEFGITTGPTDPWFGRN